MPNIETKHRLSKDGQFLIITTTITDIKPVNYIKKVLEGGPR